MSDDALTNFDIAASLNRIEKIVKSNPKFEEKISIPSESEATLENGCYVQCVALSVDIRGSSELPNAHTRPILAKIYRAYLSEASAVMRSCRLNRHIRIVGDAVLGVFTAPRPANNVTEVFEVGARISTIITALNDELTKQNYQNIAVGIGISYGRALRIKAGHKGSGVHDFVWMGDVVNSASKLCNKGSKSGNEQFMVCPSVYDVLPASHTQHLSHNVQEGCYHGTIHHVKTAERYEKIKASRLSNSRRTALVNGLTGKPYRPSLVDYAQPAIPSTYGSNNSSLVELAKLGFTATNEDKDRRHPRGLGDIFLESLK